MYNAFLSSLIIEEMKSKWHLCPGREIVQAEGL